MYSILKERLGRENWRRMLDFRRRLLFVEVLLRLIVRLALNHTEQKLSARTSLTMRPITPSSFNIGPVT